jgi:hypothetical protein
MWLSLAAAWGAALAALYLHPALWALFALVLGALVYERARAWRSGR